MVDTENIRSIVKRNNKRNEGLLFFVCKDTVIRFLVRL